MPHGLWIGSGVEIRKWCACGAVFMTLVFYIISSLAIVQGIFGLLDGIRAARHIRKYRPRSSGRPRVVVFCPCKGIDSEFRANIESILDQDYPPLRAVFVVESEKDMAYAELRKIGATVLVAGIATARGQKVHNLIHGVEHAAGDAEVFVFCDSDARFPRNWISNLVAPLEEEDVAVSTGYRWYTTESGSIPALLRSIWNASVVTALGPHSRNFAWGGSMALRREVFDRIGVRAAWDCAVSDDFAVTQSARAAGMRIVFVPECLIPSPGGCTFSELLEFTTRQIIITRVYEAKIWRLAFLGQTIFNMAFWWSLFRIWAHPTAVAVWLGIYSLSAIKSAIRLAAVSTVLPSGTLSNERWSYILLTPLGSLLYEYNMLRSAFTRNILWRQRRYSLISPQHTIVQPGAERS
jgi:cellulose synthase/poly-beta-1,6-N-acetylglucosamine synthase-like glycosyltransferase